MGVRLGYRPELDGVRGISILAVLMFHVFPKTGGWIGVQVFFVLSGFLITSLLVNEWNTTGAISLRAFVTRRARRLLPALYVALAAYVVLAAAVHAVQPDRPGLPTAARGVALGVFFVTNIASGWWSHVAPAGVSHLWSLSTEEQFYLVWPLSLVVLLRRGFGRRSLGAIAAVAAVAVAIHAAVLEGNGNTTYVIRPDSGSAPLFVGCACALMAGEPWLTRLLAGRVAALVEATAAVAVIAYLLDAALLTPPSTVALMLFAFAVAVGFILLRITLVDSSKTAGLLRHPALVALGRVSYGLYLWHVILINATPWVPALFAALVAIPVAFASHRFIEKPFLQRNARSRHAPDTPPTMERAPVLAAAEFRPA